MSGFEVEFHDVPISRCCSESRVWAGFLAGSGPVSRGSHHIVFIREDDSGKEGGGGCGGGEWGCARWQGVVDTQAAGRSHLAVLQNQVKITYQVGITIQVGMIIQVGTILEARI